MSRAPDVKYDDAEVEVIGSGLIRKPEPITPVRLPC